MTAPDKPWERMGLSLNNVGYQGDMDPMGSFRRVAVAPPPLPPRYRHMAAAQQSQLYRPIGGMGGGMFPSYSMYGGGWNSWNHGLGYGASAYGRPGEFENRFVQMAEESSQPAFQNIESFVRAFSSVTMMMESTYQAMTMSFRAVLSVAENMSRLRNVLGDLFSSFYLFRKLVWLYKRLLYAIGLIKMSPEGEEAWKAAEAQIMKSQAKDAPTKKASMLPLMTFFGVMLGTPYLLYRMLSPNATDTKTAWDFKTDGVPALAMHDFNNALPGEIPFKKGEVLIVSKSGKAQSSGWIMAAKGDRIGYIPADRVSLIKKKEGGAIVEKVKPKPHTIVKMVPTEIPTKLVTTEEPVKTEIIQTTELTTKETTATEVKMQEDTKENHENE